MTWSYSGNPATSAKDQVRFLVGDTNPKEQLLTDQEIEFLLTTYNQFTINAAVQACEAIIGKYSRLADETVGRVSIQYSQKAKGYMTQMKLLRNRMTMSSAAPYVGGISITDKQQQAANTDRVRPDFSKHMMENYQIAPWSTANQFNLYEFDEQI